MLTTVTKPRNPARRRSVLAVVAAEAKRAKLIETLDACGWNLTATAKVLAMTPQGVSKALQELAPQVYDAATADGRIAGGRPSKKTS